MNYTETLDWIFHRLPMYQKQGKTAFKPGLENIRALAKYLRNPEKKFKSVHIGGTNGKGSTANMMASVFQEAGYKTGLYTSPHLRDFRERIRIDGQLISKHSLVDFIEKHKDFIEKQECSFFELGVAMAFDHFATEQVDIAFIEVGLGGRLDATNIIDPELSLITNIGLDHTNFLGETHAKIAKEKAGIIKNKTPVVIGENNPETAPVFREKAKAEQAEIVFALDNDQGDYELDLLGKYQQKNLKTALAGIRLLQNQGWDISEKHLKNGLRNVQKNTSFIGRFSVLGKSPSIVADTAHNAEGLKELFQQINDMSYERLFIILGIVNDKSTDRTLPLMPKGATYFFCKPNVPRGMPAEKLQNLAKDHHLYGKTFPSVEKALQKTKSEAGKKDLILVTGSTFTVAEII
jgi:dihydrofolate synthase/folylpolyglutamate synthase